MFRNLFRGSQRAITTVTRLSASRQTPILFREAFIRQPRQSQPPYADFRLLAGSRPYSSQSKLTVNSRTDVNGWNKANNKSDNTTQRGIICRAAAKAERQRHLALTYRVPEKAGRENQLAHVHRVPPRSYRKHQPPLRTTSQMIRRKTNARAKIKALRETSAKLDKIELGFEKKSEAEEIHVLGDHGHGCRRWNLRPEKAQQAGEGDGGRNPKGYQHCMNDRFRSGLVIDA
ncbi:hypothetical protein CKAH01_00481 [Colletotrichum kahawae]|uniref:Uncharacterized protein n=1 Tax=Colletotrichum kahawae TaxID=34407 RepID=A0AAE0DEG5_COLKA|nr:hypothetical protein CKAH01_00481 [Colletotrichum kahawae]